MSDYDTDVLMWSERQAELLRRIANSEPLNETPDWDNIIEELLDVGRSDLRAVESLLFMALLHRLKVTAWPAAQAASHWAAEERAALTRARRLFLPSMRQRINVAEIYQDARDALPETVDGVSALAVPESCPFTLETLLASVPRAPGV